MSKAGKQDKYQRYKGATVISGLAAVAIFIFDSFMMGSPGISMIVLLYLVFYLIPLSLMSIRNKPRLKYFGYKAIIYTILVAASLGFHAYDISLAEARSREIITAVDKFYQEQGTYPGALENLVPAYLPGIPRPRLGPGAFYYLGAPENPHLMYADFPPFGRKSWSFTDRKWITID